MQKQQYQFDVDNNTVFMREGAPTQQIVYTGDKEANTVEQYFSFINDIESLTQEEKTMLQRAIHTSTSSTVNGVIDSEPLAIAQTNFELTYLNQNFIPEDYQNQMQQAIERYTSDKLSDFNHMLPRVYENLERTLRNIGEVKRADSLQQTIQGMHYLQQDYNTYQASSTVTAVVWCLYNHNVVVS